MKLLKLKLLSRQKTEVATPKNNKKSLKRYKVDVAIREGCRDIRHAELKVAILGADVATRD